MGPGPDVVSQVIAAVWRHSRIVLLVALITTVAGVGFAVLRSPRYKATTELLVSPVGADATDPTLPLVRQGADPTRTIQTAASLVDTPQAAGLAAQRMGRGWTTERVRDAVTVVPQGESDVLAVTAQAGSQSDAIRLANAFANASLEARRRILQPTVAGLIAQTQRDLAGAAKGSPEASSLASRLTDLRPLANGRDPTLSITELAQAPVPRAGPSKIVIGIIAVASGLLLGVVAAVLIETVRRALLG